VNDSVFIRAPWPESNRRLKRQGQLLAFSMSGAMALALSSCDNPSSSSPMIVPPGGFNPSRATIYNDTNSPPTSPCVYSGGGNGSYLSSRGYYHIYGYPGYYYQPAPGSTVEFVEGGSTGYSAGSPEEAQENVARGGFGEGGEGEGHGGGGEGGGE
jgi:hypothetical protein